MTPHTPLIEALKEARKWIAGQPDTSTSIYETNLHMLNAIDDALRIATETTEPDAAQSQSTKAIRAEAITDCVRVISDFVARKNIDGLTQELITAIRSLGDRG